MKNTIIAFVFLTLLSCNNDEKKTSVDKKAGFQVEYIQGYFPKNDIEFSAPVKAMVISNQKEFNKYFGVAKTMDNAIPKIDFKNNKIAAIISAPNKKKQTIEITDTKLKNSDLQVTYKLNTDEEAQSYTSTDLKMFAIPRSVTGVIFSVKKDSSATSEKH